LTALAWLWVVVPVGLALPTAPSSSPEDAEIWPGPQWEHWLDTDGNRIHAHGGGILEDGGMFYWVGTTEKQHESKWLSEGINLYSSDDLQHWKFEAEIFHNTSIQMPTPGPYRIERPKIIYNRNTSTYVLWFHLDDASFSLRSVGVATSPVLVGQFAFQAGFQPDGLESLDMSVFKDEDDKAYLVRSVANEYAGISQLTDDYLNTTGIISKGPRIEGQAIFKLEGRYYLLGSHLTGWAPNPASLSVADRSSLHGAQWLPLGNPSGSNTTFNSQSTFVLPYRHPNGHTLMIFMGDRWASPEVDDASYIWLPMVAKTEHLGKSDDLVFAWHDHWRIGDYTTA